MLATLQFGNINRSFDLPHEGKAVRQVAASSHFSRREVGYGATRSEDGSEFQSDADRPAAYARAEQVAGRHTDLLSEWIALVEWRLEPRADLGHGGEAKRAPVAAEEAAVACEPDPVH